MRKDLSLRAYFEILLLYLWVNNWLTKIALLDLFVVALKLLFHLFEKGVLEHLKLSMIVEGMRHLILFVKMLDEADPLKKSCLLFKFGSALANRATICCVSYSTATLLCQPLSLSFSLANKSPKFLQTKPHKFITRILISMEILSSKWWYESN